MRKRIYKVLALCMALSFINFAAHGQEAQQVQAPLELSSGNITLDFKDADIKSVLKVIALRSGVNIVAGPEVEGTISVRLADVPWDKALDVILKTYGFVYEREGNIIRVTTAEHLVKDTLDTEIFSLNYAKSKEAMESVKDMLSERGKMRYDERTNVLIVTDIPTNLYKIGQIIATLDKKTPQVFIDAKIIETTLADYDKLGIDWTIKATASGAKRPTTTPWKRQGMQPFNKDANDYFPMGDPAASGPAFPDPGTANFPSGTPSFPFTTSAITGSSAQFLFGTLDFTTFSAVLEVLNTKTDTRILANPKITTLNNKEASILLGEILNLPKYDFNSATGRLEITGYTEKELGTKLKVTPHINEKNEIVVDLKPEVSALAGYDEISSGTSGTVKAPRFTSRSASTQVMIKDGDTIAIGGLIKETTVEYENKVPILGYIPIIGLAFTKKNKTIDRIDLLVFVTVRLVEERGDTKALEDKENVSVVVPLEAKEEKR